MSATTLTCTSTSVSRSREISGFLLQEATTSVRLSGERNSAPLTGTSPREVNKPQPSNGQTANTVSPIATVAAVIESPRRPDRKPLSAELVGHNAFFVRWPTGF